MGETSSSHHWRDTWLASSLELTCLPIARGARKIIPGAAYPLGAPSSVSTTVRLAYGGSPIDAAEVRHDLADLIAVGLRHLGFRAAEIERWW